MGSLPLEGIRVVELGEAWAGPYGGTLLGDMGAEVIKVESIQRVPITRSPLRPAPGAIGYVGDEPGDRPWERFDSYNSANRNKMGITLDLTRPKGLTLLKRLVALSDIVIENYAAGQVQKLGIDYPALRAVKPDIIMISMPGFGVEGPYKGFVTLGDSIDAVAGHTALRGYPDEDLSQSSNILHPDAVAAVTAVFAVLTALNFRLRTGEGQFIDMSQAESVMPHLGAAIMDYTMNGRVQSSLGNRHH
ncbi:MAG: CoA transferase, partial [Chloroflexi bacterium]|nr:CoA transferase [Chloroflexota bacterium]